MTIRMTTNVPGQLEEAEMEGLDDTDLAAIIGDGYDASDPKEWPQDVLDAARSHWAGGESAFDRWLEGQ